MEGSYMNDFEEKDLLLNKVKQLKNELILKNDRVVFNSDLFGRRFNRGVYEQLSTLLNYKDLGKVIFTYLEEKRKYKMLNFYEEVNVFAKKNYEQACSALDKILDDEDVINVLNQWFMIYENEQNDNNMLDGQSEIDKQIEYDGWDIPDEKCEEDEQKTRRY